ncbi:hypothetical protein N7486_005625 [Penicillium sp. IBT 16267x]|nr:hypothetical protein N7486_005625 [Penicillium sp. IBT 16267x]
MPSKPLNCDYKLFWLQICGENSPRCYLKSLCASKGFSDDFSTQGHIYGFKSHGYDEDPEHKPNISAASPPSSVGAQIGKDDNGEEESEELNAIPSRKLKNRGDIEDILHDCVQIQFSKAQGILP